MGNAIGRRHFQRRSFLLPRQHDHQIANLIAQSAKEDTVVKNAISIYVSGTALHVDILKLLSKSNLFPIKYTFHSQQSADSENIYFSMLSIVATIAAPPWVPSIYLFS